MSTVRDVDHAAVESTVRAMRERLPELTDRLVGELGEGAEPDPARRRLARRAPPGYSPSIISGSA
jgi:hypothetical protein